MSWISGIATYVVTWWVVLFAILPFGVKPVDRPEPGMAPSAPERPRLWLKAAATTLVAAVLWAVFYAVVRFDLINLRTPLK